MLSFGAQLLTAVALSVSAGAGVTSPIDGDFVATASVAAPTRVLNVTFASDDGARVWWLTADLTIAAAFDYLFRLFRLFIYFNGQNSPWYEGQALPGALLRVDDMW